MKRSEFYEILRDRVNTSPVSRFIGQEVTEIKRGTASISMEVRDQHLQAKGQVHGGFYGLMSDTAGFFAVMSVLDPEDGAITIEYKINLVAAAVKGERLTATGRVVSRSGSMAVANMEVRGKDGTLYASGMGTYRIFPGKAGFHAEKNKGK